jgi:hypothetical protein
MIHPKASSIGISTSFITLRIVRTRIQEEIVILMEAEFKRDKSTPSGSHLDTFLGDDGLTRLLAMLGDDFQPRNKLLEIIMRLHVDNYEQAFPFLETAVSEGCCGAQYAQRVPLARGSSRDCKRVSSSIGRLDLQKWDRWPRSKTWVPHLRAVSSR